METGTVPDGLRRLNELKPSAVNASFVVPDALPLTPGGAVDYKSLPAAAPVGRFSATL